MFEFSNDSWNNNNLIMSASDEGRTVTARSPYTPREGIYFWIQSDRKIGELKNKKMHVSFSVSGQSTYGSDEYLQITKGIGIGNDWSRMDVSVAQIRDDGDYVYDTPLEFEPYSHNQNDNSKIYLKFEIHSYGENVIVSNIDAYAY